MKTPKIKNFQTPHNSPPFFTPPNSLEKTQNYCFQTQENELNAESPSSLSLNPNEIKIKTQKPHDSKSIFLDFPSFSQKIIDIGKKKTTKNKEGEVNPISLK